MASNGKKIWFPAKRYGWGWGLPVTWQGWVVLQMAMGQRRLTAAGRAGAALCAAGPALDYATSPVFSRLIA